MITDERRHEMEDDGWTFECESPLEIRHSDGSVATGRIAEIVADSYVDDSQSISDRAGEITDQVVGKMIEKEFLRLHPSSPWDRETVISFIRHAALQGLVESREIAEGLRSPSAIADMMTALVGTLDQMEDFQGLPSGHERQKRRREIEGEVLRLSRKIE